MPRTSVAARLQRVLLAALLLLAGAAVVLLWPRSPLLAIAVGLCVLFSHAFVLGFELLMLPHASRGDPTPLPTRQQRWRAWLVETLLDIRVFAWQQPFAWNAIPDRLDGPTVQGRTGIVFVHGFICNRGFWNPWMRAVHGDGRAFVAVNLEPLFAPIDNHAHTVQEAVRRVTQATGRPPVLVCHSMGGLVARAWLCRLGNPAAVAHVVTIGTPHRGTWLARFSRTPNGQQMRSASTWLCELETLWAPDLARRYTCWYSNCDNVVLPPTTATLPGADNRCMSGRAHVELGMRAEVMQATFSLLERLDTDAAAVRVQDSAASGERVSP